jgi:hypothetical protein
MALPLPGKGTLETMALKRERINIRVFGPSAASETTRNGIASKDGCGGLKPRRLLIWLWPGGVFGIRNVMAHLPYPLLHLDRLASERLAYPARLSDSR